MSSENLFFTILPGHIYTWSTHLGTCMVELIKPSCQAKNRRIEAVFHLNNTVNVSLNFKKKLHIVRIFMKDTPILALKIIERGWAKLLKGGWGYICGHHVMVMLNCHFVYLAIPATCPLLMRKQNLFVLYIYNRKK